VRGKNIHASSHASIHASSHASIDASSPASTRTIPLLVYASSHYFASTRIISYLCTRAACRRIESMASRAGSDGSVFFVVVFARGWDPTDVCDGAGAGSNGCV
jgi:hypothetical protein